MTGTDLKHRLAAILAADAAGNSRLMSADERGTVAALDAGWAVFRKYIESNQGRVVDTAGDSVLAVFDGHRPLLFDVRTDLAERDNRIAQHGDMARRLNALLQAWQKDVDAEAKVAAPR